MHLTKSLMAGQLSDARLLVWSLIAACAGPMDPQHCCSWNPLHLLANQTRELMQRGDGPKLYIPCLSSGCHEH